MFERFTDTAERAIGHANAEARRCQHEYLDSFHILIGVVKVEKSVGSAILRRRGIDVADLQAALRKLVKVGDRPIEALKLPQTPSAKRAIEYAIEECRNLGHKMICADHLFLGVLREEHSVSASILNDLQIKIQEVREEIYAALRAGRFEDGVHMLKTESGSEANASNGLTLRQIQDLIEKMYSAKDRKRGPEGTFLWLMEEVGELATAVREGTREEKEGEYADVLAWLVTLANVEGIDLTHALRKYTEGCPGWGKMVCSCNEKP